VTQTLRKALMAAGVPVGDIHVLARTGGVYGLPMLDVQDQWAVPNLETYKAYQLSPRAVREWVERNRLDVVVFNEEYDWQLPRQVKAMGRRAVTYLDFYGKGWEDKLPVYDRIWCSSKRSYGLMRKVPALSESVPVYIGWAVDQELFKPGKESARQFTFFHNAGWFGINMRKGTTFALAAFKTLRDHWERRWTAETSQEITPDTTPRWGVRETTPEPPTMLVHQQLPLESVAPKFCRVLGEVPGLTYHTGTVRAPGMYHRAKCLVMPTKLEGLGLPLFEAMACGLPVIATDEPPMNEFIEDGVNGWLIPVERRTWRPDGLQFPECQVDLDALARIMNRVAGSATELVEAGAELEKAGDTALYFAREELRLEDLGKRLLSSLEG
jgi:glycosyltransferase involved in cell wall biosynthesis